MCARTSFFHLFIHLWCRDVSVEHSGDGSGGGTNAQGDSAGHSACSGEGGGRHKKRPDRATVTAQTAAAGSGCDRGVVALKQEASEFPSPQTGGGQGWREVPRQQQQREQGILGEPEEGSDGDVNPADARKLQQRHAERQRRDMARRSQVCFEVCEPVLLSVKAHEQETEADLSRA